MKPVSAKHDRLALNHCGTRSETAQRLTDAEKTVGPIMLPRENKRVRVPSKAR